MFGAVAHRLPLAAGPSPTADRTFRDIARHDARPCCSVMESRPSVPAQANVSEPSASLAEELPDLYRQILDRVADLERIGARADAARIRAAATRAYSNSWDEAARRVLTGLIARADRAVAGAARPKGWSLRRRGSALAR
jgi:hypothetical protein